MRRAARTISSVLALSLVAATGACVSSGDWRESNSTKRNEVELVRMTHTVRYDSGQSTLSDSQRRALDRFLKETDVGYGDEIWIDAGDTAAARARRDTLVERLRARGLPVSTADVSYGPEPASNEARLVVGRYIVTPPECPDWRKQETSRNYGNTPSSNLGCATTTNLGLMVADPHDLIEGKSYSGMSGGKAATAVEKYRAGEVEETEDVATGGGGGGE